MDQVANYESCGYPDLDLVLVQIVHRHGERTPIHKDTPDFVENNHAMDCKVGSQMSIPSFNGNSQIIKKTTTTGSSSLGLCSDGQLTDKGRTTMNLFGSKLRSLYVDKLKFLPMEFDPKQIYLRSSNFQRTIESLHSVVDGLYPQKTELEVYSRSSPYSDNIILDFSCKYYTQLKQQFDIAAKEMVLKDSEQWPKRLREVAMSKKGEKRLVELFDNLSCAKGNHKPIKVTDLEFELISSASTKLWFHHMDQSPLFPKLMIGRFFHELQELVNHHVVGNSTIEFSMHLHHMNSQNTREPPKLALYSCHDTSLVPILGGLGVWNQSWPLFGSNITFELFKNKKRHYMRTKLNGTPLFIPACAPFEKHYKNDESICTLEAFKQVVDKLIMTQEQHVNECLK